jgi:hypothetical protein
MAVDVKGGTDASASVYTVGGGLAVDPSCATVPGAGYEAGTETCYALWPDAGTDGGTVCVQINLPADSWATVIVACSPRLEAGVCGSPLSRGGPYCCILPERTYTSALWCVPTDGFREFAHGDLLDTDGDTIPDLVDNCPTVPNVRQLDTDGDGFGDACDNCPYTYKPDQLNTTGSSIGDACNCALPRMTLGGRRLPLPGRRGQRLGGRR